MSNTLSLRELVSLPEGTKVEYWVGCSYGAFNPVTIRCDGYPVDSVGDVITLNNSKIFKIVHPVEVWVNFYDKTLDGERTYYAHTSEVLAKRGSINATRTAVHMREVKE